MGSQVYLVKQSGDMISCKNCKKSLTIKSNFRLHEPESDTNLFYRLEKCNYCGERFKI